MNRKPHPMKRLRLIIAALMFAAAARAQQDPMYTLYMWNMMTVNPGYTGSADMMNATITARRQWVGMDGAPATNSLLVHSPLRNKALGVGISFVDDRIGPSRNTGISGDFAYRIRTRGHSRLAFGLKAGFSAMRMRMTSVPNTDPSDPVYQRDVTGGMRPNFGFGMYYWGQKGYVGISTPKLLQEDLVTRTESGDIRSFTEQQHYFLIAGCILTISPEVKFRPSALIKAVKGAPIATDVSANFLFMEKLWAGAAYRSAHELSVILSYRINDQLRAGYSYDFGLSGLRTRHGGSHELMVSYDLTFTKRLLRSPRYF